MLAAEPGLPELVLASFQLFLIVAGAFQERSEELNLKLLLLMGLFAAYVVQAELLRARGNEPMSIDRIVPSLEDVFIHHVAEEDDAGARGGPAA